MEPNALKVARKASSTATQDATYVLTTVNRGVADAASACGFWNPTFSIQLAYTYRAPEKMSDAHIASGTVNLGRLASSLSTPGVSKPPKPENATAIPRNRPEGEVP